MATNLKTNALIMKLTCLVVLIFLLISCQSFSSKQGTRLGVDFKDNFAVLDSIIQGKKSFAQLTHYQTGFLYIVSSWAANNTKMNYSGHPQFTKQDLEHWRKWYSRNAEKISEEDFYKSLNIYVKTFKTGITSEEDSEYLHKINNKYRQY